MAIKGVKTIDEYLIMKWVEETFMPGCVTVNFENGFAVIRDKNGEMMVVSASGIGGEIHVWTEREMKSDFFQNSLSKYRNVGGEKA